MAVRFLDSFAHYASADIGRKYSATNGTIGTQVQITAASGRWGGPSLRLTGTGSTYVDRALSDNQATLLAGCAISPNAVGSGIVGLFCFMDGTSGQVQVVLSAAGLLAAYRITGASAGTLLGTASHTAWTAGAWHHVEAKVTFHASAGTVDLSLDGVPVLALTSQDTNQTANAYANKVRFGQANGGQSANSAAANTLDFSDLFILDGNSPNNSAWGDTRIYALLPTGAGATTAWTPSAGSNYQAVDDAAPDGDGTYVATATVNAVDTYALGDIPGGATVKAVQTVLDARKDDAAARQVAPVLRPASTDRVGTAQALTTTYALYTQQYDVSPETAAAWTASEINGMSAGIKCVS